MRAAVVRTPGAGVGIEDLPVPVPGPGEVLVRLEACGVCRTDAAVVTGYWPVVGPRPMVIGHEGIGFVEEVGPGVEVRRVGQRVAVSWLAQTCGTCRACLGGHEHLCPDQKNPGITVDGALAEYAVVDARFATLVPDGVPSADAAPLTCAGVAAYRALRAARPLPGETVAIVGVGATGHLAVQYAQIAGAVVVAVDIEEHKLDLARNLGADHTINARAAEPYAVLGHLGGADVVVVTAPEQSCYEHALTALRPGGRLVCTGVPTHGQLAGSVHDAVRGGLSVLGVGAGTRNDLDEVLRLHQAGRTVVVAERRPLEQVHGGLEDLQTGKIPGALVIDL